MWLFTTRGFYSVVEKPSDKEADTLTVRARSRQDLANLSDLIEATPYRIDNSDYPWRITVDRKEWNAVMVKLTEEIQYDNFKDAVCDRNPDRYYPYINVWWTLLEIEDEEEINLERARYRRYWENHFEDLEVEDISIPSDGFEED